MDNALCWALRDAEGSRSTKSAFMLQAAGAGNGEIGVEGLCR